MNAEELKKIALEYINGKSFRQIGKEIGKSHVTVRNLLTKKLKMIDFSLYEKVMDKVNENLPKSIENPEICKRVLLAYKLLITKNLTINEISNILETTPYIIYRDLTKRLELIHKVSPENVSKEMLAEVSKILKNHSMNNLISLDGHIE